MSKVDLDNYKRLQCGKTRSERLLKLDEKAYHMPLAQPLSPMAYMKQEFMKLLCSSEIDKPPVNGPAYNPQHRPHG